MGLLTVPKKYNPRGNGKRDMEYPIFATKQEQGLLRAHGGSGRMTKHGILSFGLGDKGNAMGSGGGSNYAGDGAGGQVNLDKVGGNTGNVLQNIAGKWTIVSKSTGQPVGSSSGSRATISAPAPPVIRPSVPLDPQIMGRLQQALGSGLAGAAAGAGAMASGSLLSGSMGNRADAAMGINSMGSAGGNQGYSATNKTPVAGNSGATTDPYGGMGKMGFNSGQTSPYNQPAKSITDPYGGMGKMGINSGQTSPYNSPQSGLQAPPSSGDYLVNRQGALNGFDQNYYSISQTPPGSTPIPVQNPLRNTDLIRTDSTFNADSDFGTIAPDTLSRLVSLQKAYGKPITVTEGSASLNTHAKNSQHHIDPITGKSTALDLRVPTGDRATLASLADQTGFGGIGAYNNFPNMIHVDTRAANNAWGPGGRAANINQLNDPDLESALMAHNRNSQIGGLSPYAAQNYAQADAVNAPGSTLASGLGGQTAQPQSAAQTQTMAEVGPSMWQRAQELGQQATGIVKTVYGEYTDANKKINQLGGPENAIRLAGLAQKISNFLPGGSGLAKAQYYAGRADGGGGGWTDGPTDVAPPRDEQQDTTPTTPSTTPEMWSYPLYTQAWANLPTGIGGPIWKPKPPSEGLFSSNTSKKKKKATA